MAYARLGERTALFRAADQLDANPDELRQAHRLIMETTRFQNRLEHYVSLISKGKLDEMPHGVSGFLKILAFLRFIDQADKRQLRLAISSARQILGWKILRPYEETIGRIVTETGSFHAQNDLEKISLETCHPTWYAQRISLVYGRDVGLQILNRNLKPIPLYVRLNPLKADSSSPQSSINAAEVDGMKGVWKLNDSNKLGPQQLDFVKTGKIIIQDLSAIVSSTVASPQPGDRVLDVCAAPGNKTSHLAALMNNKGEIFSIDVSRERMTHWKKEIDRVGCLIANGIIADARRLMLNVEAEVVLVDPPCSNTGVFAKNPTMKWRLSVAHLQTLITRQAAILNSASKHVRAGGTLVYSTCSILPEENEDVISSFLRRNSDFTLERQKPFLGSSGLKGLDRCQRFYPNLHECNGYFIAKLRRL